MKTQKGYLPRDTIYPFKGLNTLDPSPQANVQTSPDLVNMDILKGALSKRRGYSFQGSTVTDPLLGVAEFEDSAGSKHQLAFTTRKQFQWSGSDWTEISNTSSTWTGSLANPIEIVPVAGLDGSGNYKKLVLFTNGKDTPKYWDGITAKVSEFVPTGITNFKTFRSAAFFYDHLVLANVTLTTSVTQPNIIYWSDTTTLFDFAGVNAGAVLLSDISGQIWKLVQLGDRLAIYAENSISTMTYVGGNAIYTFDKVVEDSRLVSMRGVVNISGFHLYMNQDNIIFFDGSKLLQVVGDQIMRSYREELYVNGRTNAFAFHDFPKQRVYFNLPTGPSASKVYVMEYNLLDKQNSSWVVHAYADQPTCMGSFSRDISLRYNSSVLVGVTYNACNFTYNQATVKGGFPLRVFGTESGRVCLCDELVTSDAGEAIDSHYDTIDFTIPGEYQSAIARWIELEFEARGFETSVLYSTNQGKSFQSIEDVALTGDWKRYKVFFDVSSDNMRFRFTNACLNSKFSVRWLRVWLRPGGPV